MAFKGNGAAVYEKEENLMKNFLIIAAVLVIVGAVVFVCAMTYLGWDFSKLTTSNFAVKKYTVTDSFSGININVDTADITISPSEDGETLVVSNAPEKISYNVYVVDGSLKIELLDERRWHEKLFTPDIKLDIHLPIGDYDSLKIGISTGNTKIYGDMSFKSLEFSGSTGDVECLAPITDFANVKISTGNIKLTKVNVATLNLEVSTGDVVLNEINCSGDINIAVTTGKAYLCDVNCKNFSSNGSTGDVVLKSVIASECFDIERTTGNVSFDDCDASEINVKTSTGDVRGNFLTEKVIFATASTGKIDVPQYTSGGKCTIETSTGDIIISISK